MAKTSGRLSHAIHMPVVSVNLSILRTTLTMPETGSAIPISPKKRGGSPPLVESLRLLLRRALHRALRPVVVGDERVRREHEALRRHDERRVGALRVVRLLEERTLRPFLGGDHVPGLQ